MELSIKDFLNANLQIQTRCKTPSPRLLFGSIVGCSAFTQICLPSLAELANIIPASDSGKGVETQTGKQEDVTACDASISCPTVYVDSVEFSSIPDDGENRNFNTLDKIPTLDELTDVKPTDWAYQALKTLMERYGILSAYPDSKFRGNQEMTRYEFAAGLAITIDKVEDLVANAIGDEYIRQDAITLRRLQKQYRVVLDELQQRIDKTELKAATIQAQQFSTTTKLQGQQIVVVSGGSSAANTLVSRTRLNLLTSFQPQDLLVTQLESGNNGGDAVAQEQRDGLNYLGTAGLFANAGGLEYSDVDSQLRLRRLSYTFHTQKDLEVTIGAKISPRDFIDKNSYANNEAADFSSGAFLNNPLIVQNQIDREGGAGAVVVWNPSPKLIMRSLYVAKNGNQPNQGISGDGHQATVEVEYNPNQKLRLKLQYTNAQVNDTDINAVGLNTEYNLNKETGIFGRFGIGTYQGFNTAINRNFDATPISWSVGVTRRNVVIPGTLAGVAVGQPFITSSLSNSTQTNFEAFYNLQLNENISVTPVFSVVTNPDNDKNNGTIWQSSLRTVFSF
jgi:hypothetical protein